MIAAESVSLSEDTVGLEAAMGNQSHTPLPLVTVLRFTARPDCPAKQSLHVALRPFAKVSEQRCTAPVYQSTAHISAWESSTLAPSALYAFQNNTVSTSPLPDQPAVCPLPPDAESRLPCRL